MRLLLLTTNLDGEILVLCRYSHVVEVYNPERKISLEWRGVDTFQRETKFIGLADNFNDAKIKYPEYFL